MFLSCPVYSVPSPCLGTIQVLRQHVFGFFRPTNPPTSAYTVNQQKLPFLTPPTHLFPDVILEWSLADHSCYFAKYPLFSILLYSLYKCLYTLQSPNCIHNTLKVNKSRKHIILSSHIPKKQRKFSLFFLAWKSP